MLKSFKSKLMRAKPKAAELTSRLTNVEYTKNMSMLRSFVAVIAAVGTIFAALHVFIGFMGFDRTPDKTTGEVPSFFDVEEYQYYLVLTCLFALSALALTVLSRLPAISVLTSTATATYVMLLFDEELLTAGPMTFLMFSIFVFIGASVVTISADRSSGVETYRYVLCLIGFLIAAWAMIVYFRTIGAPERFHNAVKPFAVMEGDGAMRRYARFGMIADLAENETAIQYFRLAIAQLISVLVTFALPKQRFLGRAVSVLVFAYVVYLVGAEKLAYFPMLFVIPMIAYAFGVQAMSIHLPEMRQEVPVAADASKEQKS